MKTRSLLTLALLLTLCLTHAACGGDDATAEATDDAAAAANGTAAAPAAEAIDCPPLTVTMDGEPVAGLDHAFAYSEPENGPGTGGFGVDVFNHGDASCDDVLAGSRDVPEGEVVVKAFATEGSSRGSVAIGSKTNFAQGVELVRKAESVGDEVAICVSKAGWTTGGFGEDAGKRYEIDGLFRAEYCGERVR
jgi:hypothetical protein